ncbi:hypothetical protein ACFLUU_00895 [Chloroflexota bacterium]
MIQVGLTHQVLAYLAAAVALASVVLAGVSRLLTRPIGFELFSWMIVTGVAMLFAIYFFAGGICFRNTQVPYPWAARVRKRQEVEPSPSMLKERIFSISGNNKSLKCPFKPSICQSGYCEKCQIYLSWQELGETLVICALCGKELAKQSGLGQSVVSRAMCPECWEPFWAREAQ